MHAKSDMGRDEARRLALLLRECGATCIGMEDAKRTPIECPSCHWTGDSSLVDVSDDQASDLWTCPDCDATELPLFWVAEAAITRATLQGEPGEYLVALRSGVDALRDWMNVHSAITPECAEIHPPPVVPIAVEMKSRIRIDRPLPVRLITDEI